MKSAFLTEISYLRDAFTPLAFNEKGDSVFFFHLFLEA